MYMSKLPQVMAVVPIAVLLTTSFFVLVTIRKIEEKGLRAFGYVVAGFLWLAALIVFASAAFGLGKGAYGPGKCAKNKMEARQPGVPMQMKHPAYAPGTITPVKYPVSQEVKSSSCSKCNKGVVTKN